MQSLVDVLTKTERYLRERGVDSPRLEAELMIAHVLNISRLQIYLSHDRPFSNNELEQLRAYVVRRGKREPLAYLLGHQPFHNIDLLVEHGVLIPRQDTETLVEEALRVTEADESPVFADIGCGPGTVGLAIAATKPNAKLYAIDISETALRLTRKNRDTLGLQSRVAIIESDLLSKFPENRSIDWVVSNPPYIPSTEIPTLQDEVSKYEPVLALDGGADGLDIYRKLIPQAFTRVQKGILLEVGIHQAPLVSELLHRAGFIEVWCAKDLNGVDRVVGGRKPH